MERHSTFMDWKVMLLRWHYSPNSLQIQFLPKSLLSFFAEIDKHIIKFTWTQKAPETAKTIFRKTNVDFESYYKVKLIKTVCYQ